MEINLKFIILGAIIALIVIIIIRVLINMYNEKFNSMYYLTDVSGKWVYDIKTKSMKSIDNISTITPINIVSYGDKIYLFDEWWNLERIPENGSVIPYQQNKTWLKTNENGILKLQYSGEFGYNIEDGMIIKKAE